MQELLIKDKEPIIDEILENIKNQILNRFGLNIFNLDSYSAFVASVEGVDKVNKTYNQHKNNPNGFGQNFEELEAMSKNINAKMHKTGEIFMTTDEANEIVKVTGMLRDGKKIENLNPKDRAKFEMITSNYSKDTIEKLLNSPDFLKDAKTNNTNTDLIGFDSNGKAIYKSQAKVVKDTKILLEDRYLENNDTLILNSDEVLKHKKNLEKMINSNKISPEEKEKAKKALAMIEEGKFSRSDAKNPRTTATKMTLSIASKHIAMTAGSDAISSSISILVSGLIYEIKDYYDNTSKDDADILKRFKRVLMKFYETLKDTFLRGASFGIFDAILASISQIFKGCLKNLKRIWGEIRANAKLIWDNLYSYVNGKINFITLIKNIIKAIASAGVIALSITFEESLKVALSPYLSPFFASVISAIVSIFAGSFALVSASHGIDLVINSIINAFFAFKARDISRMRLAKVEEIINSSLAELSEDITNLKVKIDEHYLQKREKFEAIMSDLKNGLNNKDYDLSLNALSELNKANNKQMMFSSFEDFDKAMRDDEFELKF